MKTKTRVILRNDINCPKCGEKHYDIDEAALLAHEYHNCRNCLGVFKGELQAVSRPTFIKINRPSYIIYKPMKIIYKNNGSLTEDGVTLFNQINKEIHAQFKKIMEEYKFQEDSECLNLKDAKSIYENRVYEVYANYQPLLRPDVNSEAIPWGDTEF